MIFDSRLTFYSDDKKCRRDGNCPQSNGDDSGSFHKWCCFMLGFRNDGEKISVAQENRDRGGWNIPDLRPVTGKQGPGSHPY
jgi:hypothetical protein